MQNQIQTFQFNGKSIQVINKENQAWFIANEVANLLGYRDAHNLTRILDDDEAGTHNMSIRSENGIEQTRVVTIINESGLYHAAFKSRKAEVKPFRKWVTAEVLPQIRKTGKYENSGSLKPISPIEQLDGMPTRNDLWNLYLTLMDILKDVNGWGGGNFNDWASKNNPRGVSSDKLTYQELLSLIRKMHAALCSKYHHHPLQNFYQHNTALPKPLALPQTATPAPLSREVFEKIVRVFNYAQGYQKIQDILCNHPYSKEANDLMTSFQISHSDKKTGYLFVFKPDVDNDIKFLGDWLHTQSAYL